MSDRIPRVTIGLPIYNGERYLAAAIDSLLAQTYSDFELVISDNASTDGTEDICREYATRDARVRYERQVENQGLTWNFCRVVELARGEFFKWHAHDDLCAPELLETSVAALDADPDAVLAYARVGIIDDRGNLVPNDPAAWRPSGNPDGASDSIDHDPRGLDAPQPYRRFYGALLQTIWCLEAYGLMRTSVLKTTGKLRGYCSSEKVFIAEMALRGKLIEVPEVLFYVRRHLQQYTMLANSSAQRRSIAPGKRALRLPIPRQFRSTLGYLGLLPRAPIGLLERLQCFGVWVRYIMQVSKWKRIFVNTLRDTGITDGYLQVPQSAEVSSPLSEVLPATPIVTNSRSPATANSP